MPNIRYNNMPAMEQRVTELANQKVVEKISELVGILSDNVAEVPDPSVDQIIALLNKLAENITTAEETYGQQS